jgi:hypothetical protein
MNHEHLAFNVIKYAPSFGPVDEWRAFVEGGALQRGVKADLRSSYPKGKKLFWWSFSSCTRDVQALESELFLGKDGVRTLFRIEECTMAVDIQPFSSFKSEAEVLLIPGVYASKSSTLARPGARPRGHHVEADRAALRDDSL